MGAAGAIGLLAGLLLFVGAGAAGADEESARALRGMRRVSLEITFSPLHTGLSAEDLQERLEEVLRAAPPAPVIDPRSADRVRLTVAVRSVSTSDLRGYYLPLSGYYGIGPVRLTVERLVTIAGVPAPVRAVVWQAEKQARARWRDSAAEVMDILEDLAEAFLDDYRRVNAP